MPTLSVKLSKSAINFIHITKFKSGVEEDRIIYLMIKYFKSHPEELDIILEFGIVFDKRINEILKELKTDSRILQNKLYYKI